MDVEIAKAGWLHRQSSILCRWKKNWFVLYKNGTMRYFENQNSLTCEETINIPASLICIKKGKQIKDSNTPPGGFNVACLLELVIRDKRIILCAESPDDMRAWEIALEEARVLRPTRSVSDPALATHQEQVYGMTPPPTYARLYNQPQLVMYPNNEFSGTHSVQQVHYAPYGGRNVIYMQEPYRRNCSGTDVAVGAATGFLVGSMLWSPFLWWW